MIIISLLSGFTLLIFGIIIWKFKLVDILAGYEHKDNVDETRLASITGISLFILGVLLIIESYLIFREIINVEYTIFVVIGTMIIGLIIVGVLTSHYSK